MNYDIEVLKKFYAESKVLSLFTNIAFEVIWSSEGCPFPVGKNIANNLSEIENLPIKKRISSSLIHNSHQYSVLIKPLFDGIEVKSYIFELLERDEVIDLMGNTPIFDDVQQVLAVTNESISNIANGINIFEEALGPIAALKEQPLLISQRRNINNLMLTMSNISEYINNIFVKHNTVMLDLCEFLECVILECNILLSKCGRYIDYDIPKKSIAINANQRRLLIAMMNSIQNALLYSNFDSEIKLTLKSDKTNAIIQLSNGGNVIPAETFSSGKNSSLHPQGMDRIGLGLSIINQFAKSHGGNSEMKPLSTGGANLKIEIPLADTLYTVSTFSSGYSEYIRDSFSPVRIYLSQFLL